ncbi:MAG TPA: M20/M25/M40 family metallo-hydrolase, partial [Thermoleophilaceae bacterium]
LVAAECILELERLARAAGQGTVGTSGEIVFDPGLINVVPARARFSLDIRGVHDELVHGVVRDIAAFARAEAERRGMSAELTERQALPATPLDPALVDALASAAEGTGEPWARMPSGAAHDTMSIADRVPCAMVFVPCVDGISHAPEEDADPADAALAAEIVVRALVALA